MQSWKSTKVETIPATPPPRPFGARGPLLEFFDSLKFSTPHRTIFVLSITGATGGLFLLLTLYVRTWLWRGQLNWTNYWQMDHIPLCYINTLQACPLLKRTWHSRVLFQKYTSEASVLLIIKTNEVSFYNDVLTSVKCLCSIDTYNYIFKRPVNLRRAQSKLVTVKKSTYVSIVLHHLYYSISIQVLILWTLHSTLITKSKKQTTVKL